MSTKLHNVYIILLSQSRVYNYLVFSYTTSPFLTYLCHSVNRSGGLTKTPDRECVCIGDLGVRHCRVLLSSWPSIVVTMYDLDVFAEDGI